jgi:hypothetical protein
MIANQMADNTVTTTWPYCPGSGLLDRDLAENIRTWPLTIMSEAELRTCSQRQLLGMYITQHILPTLQRVYPWVHGGAEDETSVL